MSLRAAGGGHALSMTEATIVLTVAALTLIGVLSIRASETDPPLIESQATKQAVAALLGCGAALAVLGVGYAWIGRLAYPLFGLTLILLGLLVAARHVSLEPFIPVKRNTARWVEFGGPLRFQPSEFAKLAFVLALARYLRFRQNYRTLAGLLMPFLITLVPVGLILVEPDLGTAMLLLPVLFIMLFAAGAMKKHLLLVCLLGAAAAPLFYFSSLMSDYQRTRLHVLLRQNDPDRQWQMGPGFQLRQSKIAIGSGGLRGRGTDELAFFRHNLLPEDHNDFIFAVIGHRWGLVGALAVVVLYLLLAAAGLAAASSTDDPMARLIAVGVTAVVGVQAFFNISMTVGLMPITGLTLPFISAGGSSLITNYLGVGLLLAVARQRPLVIAHKPFEFRAANGQ